MRLMQGDCLLEYAELCSVRSILDIGGGNGNALNNLRQLKNRDFSYIIADTEKVLSNVKKINGITYISEISTVRKVDIIYMKSSLMYLTKLELTKINNIISKVIIIEDLPISREYIETTQDYAKYTDETLEQYTFYTIEMIDSLFSNYRRIKIKPFKKYPKGVKNQFGNRAVNWNLRTISLFYEYAV